MAGRSDIKIIAKKKQLDYWKITSHFLVLVISFIIFSIFNNVHIYKKSSDLVGEQKRLIQKTPNVTCQIAPKYWSICVWDWNTVYGTLRTIDRTFQRLDYEFANASLGDDWDVLWSSEYPYLQNEEIFAPVYEPLRPHQRVNHFPGFNYISDKSFMTTRNRDIKRILPGFSFPRQIDQFKDFMSKNPQARFVEKNLNNRGIRLVEQHEIKYDKSKKFYQLFMERPFLVEGRFMDFSAYIVLTSINPLRIYRFLPEMHIRFCPKPYYPFDANDLDKYVISDSRWIFLEFPELRDHFYKYGYSFKESIENYIEKKGHNVTELWRKIDDTIVRVFLNNEKNLLDQV